MPRFGFFSLAALALTSTAFSQKCRIQFDMRVARDSTPKDFDVKTSIFETDDVIGKGLKFSDVIKIPKVAPSLQFDADTIPIEVGISDKSIFNEQLGFRRFELLSEAVTGNDPSSEGVKTIHFSVQADSTKKIDLKHEYQLAFMEDNDFSTNQWVLKTGTIAGVKQDPRDLVMMGNVKDGEILFTTPFTEGVFHNFALTLDFDDNQISVFYSKDSAPLQNVLTKTPNDLTGRGKFHFGMLKKGISSGPGDITMNAFQPKGIDEGMIFGGIFQEDSIDGCVSTSP